VLFANTATPRATPAAADSRQKRHACRACLPTRQPRQRAYAPPAPCRARYAERARPRDPM